MEIRLADVQRRYDSGFVLDVPHLEIKSGQRVGLVGNNGAGKTTLLLLLLGLLKLGRGDIHMDGHSVSTFSLVWRSKTASYIDETCLLPYLDPYEYWQFVGDAYGIPRSEQLGRLADFNGFIELADRQRGKRKYIREYSQGNRKKIGLVAALMVRPDVVVLDEPFTSLDPRSRAQFEAMLLRLNAEHGTTMIISSHDLEHVVRVSGRMLLIEAGQIRHDDEASASTLDTIRRRLIEGGMSRAAP